MTNPSSLSGPSRTLLPEGELRDLDDAGGLSIDRRRTRPRYFDGRFLAARDLTRDQDYIGVRQSDLGRAAGSGVVRGLDVSKTAATQVTITAGLGITPSGESTVLPEDLTVDLYDLQRSNLLDGHLGLREAERTASSRARRGVFALALRPIEYTANPRRGYPTSVNGERRVEDHDIVEATAVTLVPWPGSWAGGADAARRQLAREIFVAQSGRGLAADLVPLALVYLDGAAISWVDPHLLRRGVSTSRSDLLGLGLSHRAVRASHIRQYRAHLADLAGRGLTAIAAAEHFEAIPPAGPMPLATVDPAGFTQRFFPAEVDVDITLVPADEMAAIVEEALSLPPIDFAAGSEALASTAVLVLVPVERTLFRRLRESLDDVRRPLTRRIGRLPVARSPLLALSRLRLPSVGTAIATGTPSNTESASWTQAFEQIATVEGGAPVLWYVRRRHFNVRAELEGAGIDIDTPS